MSAPTYTSPIPSAVLLKLLGGRPLNQMQQEALALVRTGRRNLVIAAPTGSGKTLLAETALVETAFAGRLGVYLAPMKAIAAEKRSDWERLATAGLHVYKTTGDDDAFDPYQARAAQILLATPEKWDGVVRRGLPPDLRERLGLVVVDEVHMIGEDERGARLEALLTRLLMQFQETRLIAMSGTIANAEELAAWLAADLYRSTWRPVPLVTRVHPYTPSGNWQRDEAERTRLAGDLARRTVQEGGAALIFCGSRTGVERCAGALAGALGLDAPVAIVGRPSLAAALANGVGYHHAGLSPTDRHTVERLFRQGDLRVLVATSTVAAGVNLPARHVIVRDLTLGTTPITASALLQMAGRAGRPGLESEGICSVIATEAEVPHVRALLAGTPAASQLGHDLATHLNTEVAVGTIRSRAEAASWYAHTLHGRTQPVPRQVDIAIGRLRKRGFLVERDGTYEATSLGQATSAQMLRASTAAALDAIARGWPDRAFPVALLEEEVLRAVCDGSAEWGDQVRRPDSSGLSEALIAHDRSLAEWEPGRLRVFGVAAALLAGVDLAPFALEDEWSLRHEVQTDLPRLLRFLARRALDQDPPSPQLGLAAADLAAALEYGVADRGASPLLEAIRRQYPPDDQRRRRVAARYAAIRSPALDGHAPLTGAEDRFFAGRPPLQVTASADGADLLGRVAPLPAHTTLYLRLGTPRGVTRRKTALATTGAFTLSAASGAAPFGEFVAVARNPLLWRYVRVDGPAPTVASSSTKPAPGVPSTTKPTPASRRAAQPRPAPAPDAWRVLESYATIAPRTLPLADHLRRWSPGQTSAPPCPICGGQMRERRGTFGRFWGCTRYPACTGTLSID